MILPLMFLMKRLRILQRQRLLEKVQILPLIHLSCFVFLMIRRPPRSTQSRSSAASDVYKRQLTPCGHGMQYLHPVQGIMIRFSNSSFTFLKRGSSAFVNEFGTPFFVRSTFCRTCSGADMPERTTVTSGWFQTQRSAHSAGVCWTSAFFQISEIPGSSLASRPPRIGSMTTMPSPFFAAYFSPFVPAW